MSESKAKGKAEGCGCDVVNVRSIWLLRWAGRGDAPPPPRREPGALQYSTLSVCLHGHGACSSAQELTTKTSSIKLASTAKAALAGLMLPIAFGIDIVVIPGPQVLTYYTLWELYKNSKNAVGTSRLTKYIAQDGSEDQVQRYSVDAMYMMHHR